MEGNYTVTGRKRKSCSSPEPPRKRQKGSEEAVEAEMPRGTKRRASSPCESPRKKTRGCSNVIDASEATEVSVQVVTAGETRQKSSTESPKKTQNTDTSTTSSKTVFNDDQLSETNDSWLLLSSSSSDSSLSPSGPSTSKQDKDSRLCYDRNTESFKAKYLQLQMLGKGGFGKVYAGYRNSDGLPVAIKHFPKVDVETQPMDLNGKTYRVPTEVILMTRVAGGPASNGESAVIKLLDWFDLEQEYVLVMERPLFSMDLNHYLFKVTGPMKEDKAKNVMKQLVEAAIQIQSQGVFHRDIKLENILVDIGSEDPRVRVIDFGCGCFSEKGPFYEFIGTPAYTPPEFLSEGKYEAGPTTVWQLGALLYELLKGDRQFNSSRFLENQVPFLLDIMGLKISLDCYYFLKMCLAVDPKQRATLEQMQQDPWFKYSCTTCPPNNSHHPRNCF